MENQTYKVRGVEFTVNNCGCLMICSDWETIYPARPGEPGKEHYGENADLFYEGFGGRHFATARFNELTGRALEVGDTVTWQGWTATVVSGPFRQHGTDVIEIEFFNTVQNCKIRKVVIASHVQKK